MRPFILPQPLTWLLLATTAYTQHIVDNLSFGHKDSLSPNGRGLPGWHVSSSNHHVQLLSDRIVLTPPVPNNAKGALWTENTIESETWSAELEFRASGQETGSGNLQVWFVRDKAAIGVDSVYNVGNFDGLALVIDQYGGRGGMIRGFLNDGSQNFKDHSSLESLAFGHCDYSYRNLGRPSKLRISSQNGLSVSIDDRECFSSNKITLPSDYYFGLTASTADQPDSFEMYKFIVESGIPHEHRNVAKGTPPQLQRLDKFPGAPEAVPDSVADDFKSQEDQFADLHNRLQGLTHQVANIFGEFDQLSRKLEERHNQVMGGMPSMPHDKLDNLNRRMDNIERTLDQVKRDVEGKDYREHLNQLNQAIAKVQGGLTDTLPDNINRCKSSSHFQCENAN